MIELVDNKKYLGSQKVFKCFCKNIYDGKPLRSGRGNGEALYPPAFL